MISIEIKGLNDLTKELDKIAKQLPFILAKTLTKTAVAVKNELTAEMGRIFDRPTPFILKSLYVESATKSNLVSEVGVKFDAVKHLTPQVFGGTRSMKRSEKWLGHYWLPGKGAKLNKYGNVATGRIVQILSVTQTHPDLYSRTTARSRKRNKTLPKYFIAQKGLHPGVWQREGKRGVKPILIFGTVPTYRPIFKFYEKGMAVAHSEVSRIFNETYDEVLK